MTTASLALERFDAPRPETIAARERDWRCGALVYQVIVDRFAPGGDRAARASLYAAPRRLRDWKETPTKGQFLPEAKVWSHEVDFWGGTLASLRTRLDHLASMSAEVLYLNPLFDAPTNHKYDTADYLQVAPEYGTREELLAVAAEVHDRGMRIVLDGVFNHVGSRFARFVEAHGNAKSPWRDWFLFGPEHPLGYRAWADVPNLPDLALENPVVRDFLWRGRDSVVRSWLAAGIDGWRLDVASDLGPEYLRELTEAAHEEKPGSLVVGEIWNYPAGWDGSLDGILSLFARTAIFALVKGEVDGPATARRLARCVLDAGTEFLLRCWTVLDNHDTERLAHVLPDPAARRLAWILWATLPGSPNLYYGSEVGMSGGADPENRAPMRWDLVERAPADGELAFLRRLLAARRDSRSLRVGDARFLDTARALGFLRLTDRPLETTLVLVNPSAEPAVECVPMPDGRLMAGTRFRDAIGLAGSHPVEAEVHSGHLRVTVPPRTGLVMTMVPPADGGHSPYKRMGSAR
jgi:glycosidase